MFSNDIGVYYFHPQNYEKFACQFTKWPRNYKTPVNYSAALDWKFYFPFCISSRTLAAKKYVFSLKELKIGRVSAIYFALAHY